MTPRIDPVYRRLMERLLEEQRQNHEVGRRVMPKRATQKLEWPRPRRVWSR